MRKENSQAPSQYTSVCRLEGTRKIRNKECFAVFSPAKPCYATSPGKLRGAIDMTCCTLMIPRYDITITRRQAKNGVRAIQNCFKSSGTFRLRPGFTNCLDLAREMGRAVSANLFHAILKRHATFEHMQRKCCCHTNMADSRGYKSNAGANVYKRT